MTHEKVHHRCRIAILSTQWWKVGYCNRVKNASSLGTRCVSKQIIFLHSGRNPITFSTEMRWEDGILSKYLMTDQMRKFKFHNCLFYGGRIVAVSNWCVRFVDENCDSRYTIMKNVVFPPGENSKFQLERFPAFASCWNFLSSPLGYKMSMSPSCIQRSY